MVEYLKSGDEVVVIWLMRILSVVIEQEVVPEVLKRGVIVPVYKEGGKDPMKTDGYRGITHLHGVQGPGVPGAGETRICVRRSRPIACQPTSLPKGCVLC